MKLLGQPTNYSEMLQRIFYFSLTTGIFCTFILSNASPDLHDLLNSISTEADIGPIKKIKALYVLIPFFIALFSRMLRLHNQISNIFKIRYLFDTKFILFPLAKRTSKKLKKNSFEVIKKNRIEAMDEVFYKYAGFIKPVIDEQIVRTAADSWGWFWSLMESTSLFILTLGILAMIGKWNQSIICLVIIFFEVLLLIFFWICCIKSAKRQIDAILKDNNRANSISNYFDQLLRR